MTTRFCFTLLAFSAAAAAFAGPADVAGIVKQIQAKRGKVVLDAKGMPVEVYLYNKAFSDADLALFKPFSGLKVLNLQEAGINDASVERIALAHPNLEVININDTKITPACVKHLAKLKSLRMIEIYNQNVTDDMIRALRAHNLLHRWRQAGGRRTGGAKSPADVQGLSLELTRITPAGLKEFADFKGLRYILYLRIDDATLRTLGQMKLLHAYWLADEGARMEARPRSAADVKSFGLMRPNAVTPEGLKELAVFSRLKSLYLIDFHVTPEALKVVATFKTLEYLSLGPSASDAGMKELAALPNLQTLILFGSSVSDAGLKEISRIKSLRYLDVGGTRITSAGLKPLAKLPLTTLNVNPGILNDETLDFLRKNKMLHVLANAKGKSGRPTSLDDIIYMVLANAPITDASIKHLVEMKSLWGINLRGTRVSDKGVAELKKALPKVSITR